jgi:ABC-type multidrug transport system fused ATPase/permease subunit
VRPRAFQVFASTLPVRILEAVSFVTIGLMVIIMLASHLPMGVIVRAASILMLTAWRILPAVNRSLARSVQIRALKPDALPSLDLLEAFSREKPKPRPEPDPDFTFDREISLKDASFHYPEGERSVLHSLNLTVKKGESAGLIGASGSGKSTMALLLSALVPPTTGEFLVDGKPLSPGGRESFFKILGFVPQNPLILDGTLADNIAFGDWGGTYDYDKLHKVIRQEAIDFVNDRYDGLKMELLGGQVKLAAIARAHYNSPKIIVFDEAASALDQASENIVRRTIKEIKGDITSIIIAHLLTTVMSCDVIYWIEDGRIRDMGPPERVIPLYEEDSKAREAKRL